MSSQHTPANFQGILFGPFEYIEGSGELRKHGVRVRLQGQPLRIMTALLKQPGMVVSRDEFQQQLWPGSTFVDFEHGLNAAVNRLRQTLGDSADEPRYVETIPGRGYRFIAPVQMASPKPIRSIAVAPGPHQVEAGKTNTKLSAKWIWLGSGALAAALVASYSAITPRQTLVSPPLRFSVTPPAGYVLEPASSRQSMALSPDGSKLAFTAMDNSGLHTVFIRDFSQSESREIAHSTGAHSVFWAQDGRSIYFTARGKLRLSPVEGEGDQVISDSPFIISSVAPLPSGLLMLSGSTGTFSVATSGGTLQKLNREYRWSQPLPGGEYILFTAFDPTIGRHRARVSKFEDSASPKDLVETDSRAIYAPSAVTAGSGYLLYVRAGNLVAHPFRPDSLSLFGDPVSLARGMYSFFNTGAADFSVSGGGKLAYRRHVGRSQLAWVDRQGRILQAVGPAGVSLKGGAISPDGKRVAASIFDPERGSAAIRLIDIESGVARFLSDDRGLTVAPVWAPDSKRLAYGRGFPGTGPKLYTRGIGESEKEEALPPDFFQSPTSWSSDGRYIAFSNTGFVQVDNEFQGDLRVVDLHQKRRVTSLTRTAFHEAVPIFSPDGRWLAFTSNESGRVEVYLQSFDAGDPPKLSGERFLVSRHGAMALRWKRDGTELYYAGADGRLYATPIDLAPRPRIGTPAPLFEISLDARGAIHSPLSFDVSPDGSRFLVPIVGAGDRAVIDVVQNWEAIR